jgi:hypothetical protein
MNTIKKVESVLKQRGFTKLLPSVEIMTELQMLDEPGRRGIYVHAMPGLDKFYVGKSIDVVARYKQHLETYGKIERSAFLHVPEGELGPIEEEHIALFRELGVTLLNVLLPDEDLGSADIAEIFAPTSLQNWVADPKALWKGGPKDYRDEELARFDARYAKLRKHPEHSEELMDLLNLFIRKCIPSPDKTEKTFWTINCLTEAFLKHSSKAVYRISVHRPEVLTVVDNPKDPEMERFMILFTVANEVMQDSEVKSLSKIKDTFFYSGNGYRTAKFPHLRFAAKTPSAAFKLLQHEGFVRSAKVCVANLMQQGQVPRNFSQSHCLPLCRDVLSRPVVKV